MKTRCLSNRYYVYTFSLKKVEQKIKTKAKRSKEIYKTIYDDIKGIGKKRKEMLLSLYPTKEALSQATIEELKQIVPLEIACRLKEIK